MSELLKSLRDALKDAAEAHVKERYPYGDIEIPLAAMDFSDGAQWLYEHLLSLAPEFDEQAAYEQAHKDSVLVDYGLQSCAVCLALWQHAQTSAIYKIREARRDEEIEELKAKLAQKDETIADIRAVLKQSGEIQDQMKEEIERLKAKGYASRSEMRRVEMMKAKAVPDKVQNDGEVSDSYPSGYKNPREFESLKAWIHWIKKNPIDDGQLQHALETEKVLNQRDEAVKALDGIAQLGEVLRVPDDWDYSGMGGGPCVDDMEKIDLRELAKIKGRDD